MPDGIAPLTQYAAELRTEDIPLQVLHDTRDLLQDSIACMLSGSSAEGVSELNDVYASFGGKAQARVLAFDERTAAPHAAFLNAVMCHANDYDDTHDPAVNHGCVAVVPALLFSGLAGRSSSAAVPRRQG